MFKRHGLKRRRLGKRPGAWGKKSPSLVVDWPENPGSSSDSGEAYSISQSSTESVIIVQFHGILGEFPQDVKHAK